MEKVEDPMWSKEKLKKMKEGIELLNSIGLCGKLKIRRLPKLINGYEKYRKKIRG